jgi:hypothetical protein
MAVYLKPGYHACARAAMSTRKAMFGSQLGKDILRGPDISTFDFSKSFHHRRANLLEFRGCFFERFLKMLPFRILSNQPLNVVFLALLSAVPSARTSSPCRWR